MQNNRLNAQEGIKIISKQNWFDKYKTEYKCIFWSNILPTYNVKDHCIRQSLKCAIL